MRIPGLVAVLILAGALAANADPSDLSGGVFISHHPSTLQFSSDPPPEGWCQHYLSNHAISTCEDQVNRIDTTDGSIWFVLAAWDEAKSLRGIDFGLGLYTEANYSITAYGPCYPSQGLELSTPNWPGSSQGTSIVITDDVWSGSISPIYYFAGYAYAEEIVPLGINQGTGFGGAVNCANPPTPYIIDDFGAMGFFRNGVAVCPTDQFLGGGGSGPSQGETFACCTSGDCILTTTLDCETLGGIILDSATCDPNPCEALGAHWNSGPCSFPYTLQISEGNELIYNSPGTEIVFSGGETVEIDLHDGEFVLNGNLVHYPPPQIPPELRPVDVLREQFGSVPYVQQRLRDNSIESWNAAVMEFSERLSELSQAASEMFLAYHNEIEMDRAAERCADYLSDTGFFEYVELQRGQQTSQEERELDGYITGFGKISIVVSKSMRNRPTRPSRISTERACSLLRLLQTLERDHLVATIRLRNGNLSIEARRRQ